MGCGALKKLNNQQLLQQRYKKTQNICKNGSTQIWQCQQNGTKQKYLIKVFKNIYINENTQKMYLNFQSQIQRLRQLAQNQQNNIQIENNKNNKSYSQKFVHYVKAHKDQKSNLILVMKYIQNKSLGDYVRGKLPGLLKQSEIANYTQQILKYIKQLRSKGKIICCNIKPTNVFFSDQKKNNVIIGDYYNLQEYFSLQQSSYKYDPIYAAPQNILLNQYFKETDIWRIGCFVLQMITCIKPWFKQTTDINKIIFNLKSSLSPPLPQKISGNCKDFLKKCFQTDHNRRISLEQLLKHSFITQIQTKQKKIASKNTQSQIKISKQITLKQQLNNFDFKVEDLQNWNKKSRQYTNYNKDQSPNQQLTNKSPTVLIRRRTFSRKRQQTEQSYTKNSSLSSQNKNEDKMIQNSVLKNNVNIYREQKLIIPLKLSQNKVDISKRFKTQGNIIKENYKISPNKKYKQSINNKQQILNLLNRNCSDQQQNKNPKFKIKNIHSKKYLKSSHLNNSKLLLNKSQNKIQQNKITLNNQVLIHKKNIADKDQSEKGYLQSYKSIAQIMEQIQASGGQKYYKKPLKLLKQKMKYKQTLRTQTSITLQDSRIMQDYQMQQINFQNQNGLINQSIHLLTNQSKISFNSHQGEVIQTAVSKAEKNRYFTEQKILHEMRHNEKIKWQKQLNQGKKLIKNQFKNQYFFSKGITKLNDYGVIIQ